MELLNKQSILISLITKISVTSIIYFIQRLKISVHKIKKDCETPWTTFFYKDLENF